MIRSLWLILASALTLSGCAGPIETRLQTDQMATALSQKNFRLSEVEPLVHPDLQQARDRIAESLLERGYRSASDAAILVHVALADRPADVAINAGEKETQQPLAPAKKQKRFQSCKDREHRLTVTLFDQVRAKMLYSGNAAEYHCKGTVAQSLPFLVAAALSGLDQAIANSPNRATRTRQGIE
ncbi:hypothetical protein [Parasphingorhabdus sp.]|uniref:hypothetical protein n=1 Tax=Parasphingorhabdus sp. TaxID=2709688 RepID=UPI0030033DC3